MEKKLRSSLCALAGFAQITIAHGAAVIHEPFAMTPGSLGGKTPSGIGLTGTWSLDGGSEMNVASPGLTFNTLDTSGNKLIHDSGGSGGRSYSASVGTSLSSAGLLADGADLWFSMLLNTTTAANARIYFGLADAAYSNTDGGLAGDGLGFNIQNGSDFRSYMTDNGARAFVTGFNNLALNESHLLVGHVKWGVGAAVDTFQLYLPGSDLSLGTALSTQTATLDQSGFDTVTLGHLTNLVVSVDELRFGASYADVSPIPEPSTVALFGLAGLVLTMRRR